MTSRHAPAAGIAIFIALFVLGMAAGVWLPFWVFATLGSVGVGLVLVVGVLRAPERFWRDKGIRGVAETGFFVAVAAYSFWISVGHLGDEIARFTA